MSHIQQLLDESVVQGRQGDKQKQHELFEQIRKLRMNPPPPCFGEDDCSTLMLSMCPWRMDCGE